MTRTILRSRLLLAETLLKLNKGEQALALVERSIERQPQGVEAYELLAKVLKALNREKEITPRLEAAARRDSKNVPLQYVLADRYRETGQIDKAEALYKELLTSQPTPQTYRALATSLLKRKKAADLLKVISEAVDAAAKARRPSSRSFGPPPPMTPWPRPCSMQGCNSSSAKSPSLSQIALRRPVASSPTTRAGTRPTRPAGSKNCCKLAATAAWSKTPVHLAYTRDRRHLAPDGQLCRGRDHCRGVDRQVSRTRRSVRTLVFLADYHRRAGHIEAAKATLREAMKLDPGDGESQLLLADRSARDRPGRRRGPDLARREQERAEQPACTS